MGLFWGKRNQQDLDDQLNQDVERTLYKLKASFEEQLGLFTSNQQDFETYQNYFKSNSEEITPTLEQAIKLGTEQVELFENNQLAFEIAIQGITSVTVELEKQRDQVVTYNIREHREVIQSRDPGLRYLHIDYVKPYSQKQGFSQSVAKEDERCAHRYQFARSPEEKAPYDQKIQTCKEIYSSVLQSEQDVYKLLNVLTVIVTNLQLANSKLQPIYAHEIDEERQAQIQRQLTNQRQKVHDLRSRYLPEVELAEDFET